MSRNYCLTAVQMASIGVGIAGITVAASQAEWESWIKATCFSEPEGCFCETINEDGIRQKANAWSNMAFILIGLAISAHALSIVPVNEDENEETTETNPAVHCQPMTKRIGIFFGMSQVLVGLTSFLYHASMSLLFQFLDIAAVLITACFLLTYAWYRLFRLSSRNGIITKCVMSSGTITLAILFPLLRKYVSLIILLLAIGFEIYYLLICLGKTSKNARFMRLLYITAGLTFVLAVIVAALGIYGVNCSPTSWLQFHAFWHILIAISLAFVYCYYVAENQTTEGVSMNEQEKDCESMQTDGMSDIESPTSDEGECESVSTSSTEHPPASNDGDENESVATPSTEHPPSDIELPTGDFETIEL